MPDHENPRPTNHPTPDAPTSPPEAPTPEVTPERAAELRRLARETKNERQVWIYLAYFFFVIHIIAFVMIYAVRHAK
ncbi:hypothetical protein [Streptomyces acidiscabies]|uniref:hypothetical protein n=1 Tax=Streptomyces acidiscabies TaxID=42234 RepID=UPI00073E1F8F|nr:hypothetical protein [Streptomyces acidiscabies]GAQ58381.1 hypothetical protein a10_08269 [Streptomyces acidiscabies]GAV44206.1 hypothetical protein Saa2_07166 [Streptomyces acidiscabies]